MSRKFDMLLLSNLSLSRTNDLHSQYHRKNLKKVHHFNKANNANNITILWVYKSVLYVARQRPEQRRNRDRIFGRCKGFLPSPDRPYRFWVLLSLLFIRCRGFSPGGKATGTWSLPL